MSLKDGLTVEGQRLARFVDDHGNNCIIQKSDGMNGERLWLGLESDVFGQPVYKRMYLTQKQVKELLPYLKYFVKTGELPPMLIDLDTPE